MQQRWLIGVLFIAAGINHFLQPRLYMAIMPKSLPAHKELVALSGVAEVLLGLIAFFPRYDRLSRWGLSALLVAVFPANLHMALNPQRFRAIPKPLLWLRLPLQALLIGWIWRVFSAKP